MQRTSKVEVVAVPAATIGEWRGVVTVNGLAEFRTLRTYETEAAAERAAEKLLPKGEALAAENDQSLGKAVPA